LVFMLTNQY